jgi:hypothetical protein
MTYNIYFYDIVIHTIPLEANSMFMGFNFLLLIMATAGSMNHYDMGNTWILHIGLGL